MLRLLGVVLCASLAAVLYLAATRVDALAHADLRVLEGFMGLPGTRYANGLVSLFNPAPFAIVALSLVLAAVGAGRRREAAAALATMLGAGVTTQVLKPLLAVQRDYPVWHYLPAESYPSGHTTAAVSLGLALVIVVPARRRMPATVAGALLSVATGCSLLMVGSHYPSDVAGGFLVATGWACAATAALGILPLSGSGRAPTAARRRRSLPARG
jgi:membrane-associated phospholipid phosphatase